jgi:hypothetical protein
MAQRACRPTECGGRGWPSAGRRWADAYQGGRNAKQLLVAENLISCVFIQSRRFAGLLQALLRPDEPSGPETTAARRGARWTSLRAAPKLAGNEERTTSCFNCDLAANAAMSSCRPIPRSRESAPSSAPSARTAPIVASADDVPIAVASSCAGRSGRLLDSHVIRHRPDASSSRTRPVHRLEDAGSLARRRRHPSAGWRTWHRRGVLHNGARMTSTRIGAWIAPSPASISTSSAIGSPSSSAGISSTCGTIRRGRTDPGRRRPKAAPRPSAGTSPAASATSVRLPIVRPEAVLSSGARDAPNVG